MADFELVSKAVLAFLNSDDLLESRQLMAQSSALLFSDDAEAYLRALAERYAYGPQKSDRAILR